MIAALVDYVATIAPGGPRHPERRTRAARISPPAAEIYRLQCAACHAWSGVGRRARINAPRRPCGRPPRSRSRRRCAPVRGRCRRSEPPRSRPSSSTMSSATSAISTIPTTAAGNRCGISGRSRKGAVAIVLGLGRAAARESLDRNPRMSAPDVPGAPEASARPTSGRPGEHAGESSSSSRSRSRCWPRSASASSTGVAGNRSSKARSSRSSAGGIAVGVDHLVASAASERGGGRGSSRRGERARHPCRVRRRSATATSACSRGAACCGGSWYASLVAIGAAFLFPLRSLGPRPSDSALDATPWRDGLRVVDRRRASPYAPPTFRPSGLVTVFPDGAVDSESGQAVLVRVDPGLIQPLPGRESWTPDGLDRVLEGVHARRLPGRAVRSASHQLLCPCHQSTFDVLDGARPVFGPAADAVAAAAARDRRGRLHLSRPAASARRPARRSGTENSDGLRGRNAMNRRRACVLVVASCLVVGRLQRHARRRSCTRTDPKPNASPASGG